MPALIADPHRDIHALYTDHHGWLVGWLRRRLGCIDSADDLAQDTFVRIVSACCAPVERSADGSRALLPPVLPPPPLALREPRAYLTTVAKRVLVNHFRRRSLEAAYLESLALLPAGRAPSPEERLVILQTLDDIDTMLDGLPPKARSAFLLAQLEGCTYAEIALRLNVATRTVKRYMAQAFEQCLLIAD